MLKKIFFISIFFILTSYKYSSKKNFQKNSVIDMVHESFDEDFYVDQDYYYISLKLNRFDVYPKYEKYLKDNYKGIPVNDSVSYYNCLIDGSFMFDANKAGDLTTENLKGIIEGENVDTLNYSKVKLKPTLISVIGFYKNKQFIIADSNRNKDFSDDIKYEYDIDFRNSPYSNIDFLNALPITQYTYEDCYHGNIQQYTRRFIIYPDRNNPFSISSRTNPKKEKEYFSILKFRDFWKGESIINNEKIEFYYHGYSNRFGIIYVKPKNVLYKRDSEDFESKYRFKYYSDERFDDTLVIQGSRYKIDSINRDISKLYLRELEKKNKYGSNVGDYMKNIDFKDLEKKTFKTDDIIGKKKYTLLEFWGTWCGPCIVLTPKLVENARNNFSKLNIISIAVDENTERVKNYVRKNKLNWQIGYIPEKGNWDNPAIKQLKIKSFPTFILVDSNGKILMRGNTETFDEIFRLVNNN